MTRSDKEHGLLSVAQQDEAVQKYEPPGTFKQQIKEQQSEAARMQLGGDLISLPESLSQ